jgi:hypothetical protein
MGCNCKWTEIVLGLIIIVFAWPELINVAWAAWVVIISGALLIVHALKCGNCGACKTCSTGMKGSMKKKRR